MPPTPWSPRRREFSPKAPSSFFSPYLPTAIRSSQAPLPREPLSIPFTPPFSPFSPHPHPPATPPTAQSERIILRRHLPHEIIPHHRQLLHDIRPHLGHIREELHREDSRHDAEARGSGAESHGAPEIDAADVGEDFVTAKLQR